MMSNVWFLAFCGFTSILQVRGISFNKCIPCYPIPVVTVAQSLTISVIFDARPRRSIPYSLRRHVVAFPRARAGLSSPGTDFLHRNTPHNNACNAFLWLKSAPRCSHLNVIVCDLVQECTQCFRQRATVEIGPASRTAMRREQSVISRLCIV